MIFDIDFNKKHKNFLDESNVAYEILASLQADMEDYEKDDELYIVAATYLMESIIKHDLPKPFSNDFQMFCDEYNSPKVREMIKILQGNKKIPAGYIENLTVLRIRFCRAMAMTTLVMTREDNLFYQLKEEFMKEYGEV